jgi:hypothetical protein
MNYQTNMGNTMAYLWWAGKRAEYFRLKKFLHCSATGSKKVNSEAYSIYTKYTFGPYPTIPHDYKARLDALEREL